MSSNTPQDGNNPPPQQSNEEMKKFGTHIMGHPASPTSHPDNQAAASWSASGGDQHHPQFDNHHPYIVYSPIGKPSDPLQSVAHMFNSWSNKAETIARNIWHNLRTGASVGEAAWGKLNLTAKAISEGGFESLYKQIFGTEANEKLKKTFACYLSTTTGPVAGTLYLSTHRVCFCSDRPLSFRAPSGQETWSYYKVVIPLGNIATVNPVVVEKSPQERYIEISTIDGHDFWYMGFVNFGKATHHLLESVSELRAYNQNTAPDVTSA